MSSTEHNQSLIDRLFSAGSHFGFSKSRRHPTMKPYLFGSKQGTDIFDLEKSAEALEAAKAALQSLGSEGKKVLFVGTKEEASAVVKEFAEKHEAPYVVNRWIGGMLTNYSEIKKRIARLNNLTAEGESGELERKYTKKERVVIGRELDKLNFNFGGIKMLEKTPDALLIVDPRHDSIAVKEAIEMNMPIIGVMSTDNDASLVTYPVGVNDALQSSVRLVLEELTSAYAAGASTYVPKPVAKSGPRARRTRD
ncbi:MAG: 30S ribosomal protein S2 [Bacteroidota bacterium]